MSKKLMLCIGLIWLLFSKQLRITITNLLLKLDSVVDSIINYKQLQTKWNFDSDDECELLNFASAIYFDFQLLGWKLLSCGL